MLLLNGLKYSLILLSWVLVFVSHRLVLRRSEIFLSLRMIYAYCVPPPPLVAWSCLTEKWLMMGERLRWVLGMGWRGDGAAGHWNSPKPQSIGPYVSVWISRVQYLTLTPGSPHLPFSSKVFSWCCIPIPILKAPAFRPDRVGHDRCPHRTTNQRMAFLGDSHNPGFLPLMGKVQGKSFAWFCSSFAFHIGWCCI